MAWFAAAAPILQAAGTGVAVAATIAKGQQEKKIGEFNAKLAEQSAKAEQDQAARDEEALRRQSNSFLGKQRAAMAEAGVGFGGSTGLLADQSAVLAELDALNIRYGGTMSGATRSSQAVAARYSGRSSGTGLLAGAQLLAGGSDYAKLRRT